MSDGGTIKQWAAYVGLIAFFLAAIASTTYTLNGRMNALDRRMERLEDQVGALDRKFEQLLVALAGRGVVTPATIGSKHSK